MASASSKDKTRKQRHATAKAIANLRPQNTRSKDEQKEIARMGGIASGKARRERKSVSQLCADFLLHSHNIKLPKGKTMTMTGEEIIVEALVGNVRAHGTSASVSMIDKIREYTEGLQAGAVGAKADLDVLSGLMGTASPNETSDDKTEGETK